MFSRAFAIARKELRELLRDPVYLGLAFIVPIILMLLLGYGLSMDVKHLPIMFVDQDQTPVSRDYIDGYIHSEYFELVGVTTEPRAAELRLRRGTARIIIEIPPDFSRKLLAGEQVALAVTVDGSFPTRAALRWDMSAP